MIIFLLRMHLKINTHIYIHIGFGCIKVSTFHTTFLGTFKKKLPRICSKIQIDMTFFQNTFQKIIIITKKSDTYEKPSKNTQSSFRKDHFRKKSQVGFILDIIQRAKLNKSINYAQNRAGRYCLRQLFRTLKTCLVK